MRVVWPVFIGLTLAAWLWQSILDSLMLSPVTTLGVRDEGSQPHLSHRDWALLGHMAKLMKKPGFETRAF